MSSILQRFILGPYEALFSETGYFGSIWQESSRNRSLMLGVPAILLAVGGLTLLAVSEFGMKSSLEQRYKARVEASTKEKVRIAKDIQRDIMMKQSSQQSVGESADKLIPADDERRDLLKRAQAEESIFLRKLNALAPEEDEYLYQLAEIAIKQKEIARGLAMMRKLAPAKEPGYKKAHKFLAAYFNQLSQNRTKFQKQHVQLAMLHIDHALRRDAEDTNAIRLKAQLMLRTGQWDEAYAQFEKLFDTEPAVYRPLYDLNKQAGRDKDNEVILRTAIDRYTEQLEELKIDDDNRIRALNQITVCYQLQGNYDAAEQLLTTEMREFAKSPDGDSKIVWAKRLLAKVYLGRAGKIEGTDVESLRQQLTWLKKAYSYDPTNFLVQRQLTRFRSSEFEEIAFGANDIYNPFQHPDAPAMVINELGIQALGESRYEDALLLFNRAKEKSPRDPEVLNNLAYTHLRRAEPNARLALRLIDDAIRYAPKNRAFNAYKSNFLDTRARALMQLGQMDAAIADFTKALVDRPDNVGILTSLVKCFKANNMTTEADIWQDRLNKAIKKQGGQIPPTNSSPAPKQPAVQPDATGNDRPAQGGAADRLRQLGQPAAGGGN